jgi:prophage tail gpP-like protein
VDDTPFANIQVLPGETQIQAIDRYAKMRNILIGSEANGGLRLIGPNAARSTGALWEGVHILRANAAVRDEMVFKRILALAQNAANDSANGDPQNKIVAAVDGSSSRNKYLVVVADVADTRHGAEQRAQIEKVFAEGSFVEAQITVQGWFKDNNQSDELWRAGEYYVIDSPSLLFNNEVLGCAGCVYEQNASGTTTTLQMVRPIHMNGMLDSREASAEFVRREAERRAAEVARRRAERQQQEAPTP